MSVYLATVHSRAPQYVCVDCTENNSLVKTTTCTSSRHLPYTRPDTIHKSCSISPHLWRVVAVDAYVAVLARLDAKVSQASSKRPSPLLHLAVLEPDVLQIRTTAPTKTTAILWGEENSMSCDHSVRSYDKMYLCAIERFVHSCMPL